MADMKAGLAIVNTGWVPVAERLPAVKLGDFPHPRSREVLLWAQGTVHFGRRIPREEPDGGSVWVNRGMWEIDGVTHWMDLPEPPEGVE